MKGHVLLPVLLSLSAVASAGTPVCSENEAYAAESITDYLDSWANVYLFFKQFRHCYDAAIAEGAEDKIQLLWANHWSTLPQMLSLTSKDAEFKTFIWARIRDETFPKDEFAHFVRHAQAECPQGAHEFCQAVISEALRGNAAQPSVPLDAPAAASRRQGRE